jgi:hypothetical protein
MANSSIDTIPGRFEIKATASDHFSWLRTRSAVRKPSERSRSDVPDRRGRCAGFRRFEVGTANGNPPIGGIERGSANHLTPTQPKAVIGKLSLKLNPQSNSPRTDYLTVCRMGQFTLSQRAPRSARRYACSFDTS